MTRRRDEVRSDRARRRLVFAALVLEVLGAAALVAVGGSLVVVGGILLGAVLGFQAGAVLTEWRRARGEPELYGAFSEEDRTFADDQRRRLAHRARLRGGAAGTAWFSFDRPVSTAAAGDLPPGVALVALMTALPLPHRALLSHQPIWPGLTADDAVELWTPALLAGLQRRVDEGSAGDPGRVAELSQRIEAGDVPVAGVRLEGSWRDLAAFAEDPWRAVYAVSLEELIPAPLPPGPTERGRHWSV